MRNDWIGFESTVFFQAYNCLRIKLLGDCYYCVSGIPNPTPSHANNCVKLGFEMIDIIKDVR